MQQEKEDKFILAGIGDEIERVRSENRICHTDFLDMRIQGIAKDLCMHSGIKYFFYGGYDTSERRIIVFLPDYADENFFFEDNPVVILRALHKFGGRELSHRDYLGSLLGLGITRDKIGDIIVYPEGADIIVLESMSEFLLANYDKAGRTSLQLSIHPIAELNLSNIKTVSITDTVQSLRLDSVVASAFKISRAKAQDAVKSGICYVNSALVEKTDFDVKRGDVIVLRGSGKCVLEEIGGESKKGRTFIKIKKYI